MAGEPNVTIIGNLCADPELRFTPSGVGVCNFTVAQTPRTKRGDDWEDGETTFWRCAVWRDPAEHAAETLTKGMRVIVTGRMRTRGYDTREGEKRMSVELDVDGVGPELRYATAKVRKVERGSGGGGSYGRSASVPSDDPWAAPATGGSVQDDEPPF